jgi:hypothetical protein
LISVPKSDEVNGRYNKWVRDENVLCCVWLPSLFQI